VFSFLYSEQKKMRQTAENWLEVADRVYKYRRDQLNDGQLQKLQTATGEVKLRLKEKADASKIKMSVESLEGVLRDTGGRVYPVSSITENVEFFLVAAIVILGLRAYFVQPFKIPTNSMWPTYYGMTAEVFKKGEEPGIVRKVARLATLGASNYTVKAPDDGEVYIAVYGSSPITSEKSARTLLVFPTVLREYFFSVGGHVTSVAVPAEFNFSKLLKDAFFGNAPGRLEGVLGEVARNTPLLERSRLPIRYRGQNGEAQVTWLPIGKKVKKGEPILNFDILTGDLLFVDRFTYNFFPPKVGQGFVFKTENIHSPNMRDPVSGEQTQQYYIKRLVGEPGDQLEVRKPNDLVTDGAKVDLTNAEGQLFRNGAPISGADAFGKNSRKEGMYPGYTAAGNLSYGQTLTIPGHSYFAMGDNSPDSSDGRFWGFVPEKDVVGRPLFIYYPLTSRWGPAR
jgi:signal peptidase I